MDFVAVDVETANPNMTSICQIGFVRFENGIEVEAQSVIVDPKTWFDPFHVDIHGVDENRVRGSKSFAELDDWIRSWATDRVVVSHTHFDRVAFSQSYLQEGLPDLNCNWLDSARVTRRAWPQFSQRGYGLANIAAHCGIAFTHHDALEDARTAGAVLIHAINETGHDLN